MSTKQRIIIYGSSNVGKTSILNELTKSKHKTSSDAIGTTFKTEQYPLFERNGIQYEFFDTAGLNETEGGLVSQEDACDNILNLIMETLDGFNLLVLVVRIGAILQADKNNYDIFVNDLTQNKVPTLCIITGCENEEPEVASYALNNAHHYAEKGMKFNYMLSTCFAKGGRLEKIYQPLRENSTNEVWGAIEKISSPQPIATVQRNPDNVRKTFTLVWNKFCGLVKKPTWQKQVPRSRRIYEMLSRMGIKDEAKKKEWSEKFFDCAV